MTASRLIVKTIAQVDGPDGAFVADLLALVKRYRGEVIEQTVTRTNDELFRLGLNSTLVNSLVGGGIRTLDELTALSEAEVMSILGVNWVTYRDIVRKLHEVGQAFAGAPPYEKSLEMLPLDNLYYRDLRSRKKSDAARFKVLDDLSGEDLITIRSVLGYPFARQLRRLLNDLGIDFTPPRPERTVRDLMGKVWPNWGKVNGLPANTLLSSLTLEKLKELADAGGPAGYGGIDYLTEQLSEVGLPA